MLRLISIAAALATSTIGATASHAQPATAGYYTATPAAKPVKTSFVTRETVWTWHDSAYTARRGSERDTIQCELVARQAGKLSGFIAGGAAFDAAQLDKCNTKAR